MTIPTLNDIQAVDPVLTNILVGYKQADTRFVASQVFPAVPVDKDSGTYYVLSKQYFFMDEMKRRAPGDPVARGGYGVSTATYAAAQWALEHKIPLEHRANNQMPLGLETIGAQWLAQQSMIRKERAWASDFMAASVWTTQDNNATTDWDDYTSGDPLKDLRTGRRGISQLTGQTPNALVVGEIVDDALNTHPDILDRVKYQLVATNQNVRASLAAVLGVEQYLVGLGIYNSAVEGQTAVYAPIIDDDALLLYVNPTPQLMAPSAGYTFTWDGGGGIGQVVTYPEQSTRSDILQLVEAWDQKVVAADLGAIWLDVV